MAYRNKKTKILQDSIEAHMQSSFAPEEAFAFAHHDEADAERGRVFQLFLLAKHGAGL